MLKKNRLFTWYFQHLVNYTIVKKSKSFWKENYKKYEGKRCFIIGNGPSLKLEDLNRLKNEITIASNKIYLIFNKTE